jgi:cellulose synthase/poly-beta-1,6-N-acetylglucosamine synthase-like glycosyltransferase
MDKRYIIVTPYFKEDKETLERCIESVKKQTVRTDHFLVADGFAQEWIGRMKGGVRHLALDKAYADYGNTPRGIGAQLAIAGQYDGIGFLDADNWIDEHHVEVCLDSARKASGSVDDCDYVIARRRFVRPDGSTLPIPEERNHVDTSCFFLLPGAYFIAPYWNLMPREVAPLCDRIFFDHIRSLALRVAENAVETVNYLSTWESHYRRLNERPPANAKPNIDGGKIILWMNSLRGRDKVVFDRLTGRAKV